MDLRDIKDYEGLYKINSDGRIYTIRFNRYKTGYSKVGNGYLVVRLWKNSLKKSFKIHRLVAKHFIPNPNNYSCVNHIDGNKLNNKVNNLEWCTYTQNALHAFKMNLRSNKGLTNHAKSIIATKNDEELIFKSARDAERQLDISHTSISNVLVGVSKTAGNYKWRYANV